MNEIDDRYDREVIKIGGEGSVRLANWSAPTLKNRQEIEVVSEGMNGVNVLRIPKGELLAVHSCGGDSSERDLSRYARSAVEKAVRQAELIGAEPIAFANVVDSRTGELQVLDDVAGGMVDVANRYGLAIMNGENAILGDRVKSANVAITMISRARKMSASGIGDGNTILVKGNSYAFFDSRGELVCINSDGQGTKSEFNERLGRFEGAVIDSAAMKADDTIKWGARSRVISDVLETNRGGRPFSVYLDMQSAARDLGEKLSFSYILQHEIGDRVRSYREGDFAFNIGGSSVNVISEERLKNPLIPHEGEKLIAIAGIPNPRSNGITALREIMTNWLGEVWHETSEGKNYLEFLAQPSTIFYPVFKKLIDEGLVTSVYHMSGGAFNGKLAKPLAKHGLYAEMDNLFEPCERMKHLAEVYGGSARGMYGKWNMRNEGFVTTRDSTMTLNVLGDYGLEGKVVAQLEKRADGKTGVSFRAFNGELVEFSGKD